MFRNVLKLSNIRHHSSKVMKQTRQDPKNYEACIELLNTLQSNAQYIKSKATPTGSHNANQLKEVHKYLSRIGLTLEKLDKLSIIHVAGTKGKGTTCAFSESILREHGYKTGFFSSPHLVEVRERIRINGKPIEKAEFAACFWEIYQNLDRQKSDASDMPLYFRFLTLMALKIFLEQKVDVAILEVGIGGEYDCTNVLRKVPVVGITSLGIDHTSLLGSSLESIAWNKAGIMKEGCRAFSVPQPDEAMAVLRRRSVEKKCQLNIVNDLSLKLPINKQCPILNLNASLAVALCDAWLKIKNNNNSETQLSNVKTEAALAKCRWPGRFHVKQHGKITFYLDGAHTFESIEICSNWFKSVTKHSNRKKVLIFNVTGGRDPTTLLKQLKTCLFNVVLFTTNRATRHDKSDTMNFTSSDDLLVKCEQHKQLWLTLDDGLSKNTELVKVFPTVGEAIEFLGSDKENYNVLATGSIHLIGAVLGVLDHNMNEDS